MERDGRDECGARRAACAGARERADLGFGVPARARPQPCERSRGEPEGLPLPRRRCAASTPATYRHVTVKSYHSTVFTCTTVETHMQAAPPASKLQALRHLTRRVLGTQHTLVCIVSPFSQNVQFVAHDRLTRPPISAQRAAHPRRRSMARSATLSRQHTPPHETTKPALRESLPRPAWNSLHLHLCAPSAHTQPA